MVKICLDLLNDAVYAVRLAAIKNIKAMVDAFGMDWCRERLLQAALTHLTTSPNYLRRVGVCKLVVELAACSDETFLRELALPALKALATDTIPNVRLSVARAVKQLTCKQAFIGEEMKGVMQLLSQDVDDDVRYYSSN